MSVSNFMISQDPAAWGPIFWTVIDMRIHFLPSRLSAEERTSFWNFLQAIRASLPCSRCRENFQRKLESLSPATFQTKNDAVRFSVSVENQIRESKKKSPIITWQLKKKRIILFQKNIKLINNALYEKEAFHNGYDSMDICLIIGAIFLSLAFLLLLVSIFKKPHSTS